MLKIKQMNKDNVVDVDDNSNDLKIQATRNLRQITKEEKMQMLCTN